MDYEVESNRALAIKRRAIKKVGQGYKEDCKENMAGTNWVKEAYLA